MKTKQIIKIFIDIVMAILLLLLMSYERIGQKTHEWLGIILFVLFVCHHILNRKWICNIIKGKYTAFRIMQTLIVLLVLFSMVGSMVSGIILSRHVLSFLSINVAHSFTRKLHMLSAYWGFVFMSIHIGIHWSMIIGIMKKRIRKKSATSMWVLRVIAIFIAIYGIHAFIKREIGSYMLLQNQFVFFDFKQPFLIFLIDYVACMGLFVVIGHYISRAVKK